MIGHFTGQCLWFWNLFNSNDLHVFCLQWEILSDHFLRTKFRPLVLIFSANERSSDSKARTEKNWKPAFEAYRKGYKDYYETCKKDIARRCADRTRNYYLSRLGNVQFCKEQANPQGSQWNFISCDQCMRGCGGHNGNTPLLPRQEAFDIE